MKYITKAEFARRCGVSPTAIDNAVKRGKIRYDEAKGIDPSNKKNRAYKRNAIERKEKLAKGRSERKLHEEFRSDFVEETPLLLENPIGSNPEIPKKRGRKKAEQDLIGQLEEQSPSEIDYAIEKMRSSTALNKARLAEMVKATVRRDFVEKVLGLMGTAISDHMLTMGDRLATDLAALAGSTDATVVRQIKQHIDADVTTCLTEMKQVVARHYTRKIRE